MPADLLLEPNAWVIVMPTVLRERGFVFQIHLDDHGPPHVHVWKAGCSAKIEIGDEATPPTVVDPGRMPTPEVRRAVRIMERNQAGLLEEWRVHHG